MGSLRIFSSRLGRRERRVYGAVLVYFLAVFVAMLWPVYSFFGRARPLIGGLPLSLFYLAVLLVSSFVILLCLYAWEAHSGRLDPDPDPDPDA